MLRPLFAFLTLCLAAFLLAPTVASVHHKVEELSVERDLPWQLWKWGDLPEPPSPLTGCAKEDRHLYSEVTHWPTRIQKDETFSVGGVVQSEEDGRRGVGDIPVDLYLNASKDKEGIHLGKTVSSADGTFSLQTSLPFALQASRYHLVAHAQETRIDCSVYFEHWSDPELEVVSKTSIAWEAPGRLVVGRNVTLGGRLLDAVDAPVRNATVQLSLDGKESTLTTDDMGLFALPYRPSAAGDLRLVAEFKGSKFYNGTRGNVTYEVLEEDVELGETAFLRSSPTTLTGHVHVAEAAQQDEAQLSFRGFRVVACEGCAPTSNVTVPLAEDGSFAITLTVPPTEKPGDHSVTVSGGGLKKARAFNATLEVPSVLALETGGVGLFSKDYEGRVLLTDETGAPIAGVVRILTAAGEHVNATNAEGVYAFSGTFAECGSFPVRAFYGGGEGVRGAEASQDVLSCGFLAFIPPWLLAAPWWVWPLVLVAGLVAWQAYRGWRQRYAPVITGGPALTLVFTEPRDDAAGYAGVGEAVVATAFLEEPLPDGHRLRMGTHRAPSELPLDAELRAHLRLVPDKLGELPIRAEIIDPKGRIVTRRTATLHVVKYAEEIERRYLRLRKETGAGESVTPREFEAWLHERAPALDGDVARRLVRVFEEADYSPRVAGRAEFAAYLAAEGGVKEVSPDAVA